MRFSIRSKITIMVMIFAGFVVGASWIVCNFFFEGAFVANTKKNLKEAYNTFNDNFENEDESEAYDNVYRELRQSSDLVILIYNVHQGNIYTSISREGKMYESINVMLKAINDGIISYNIQPGEYVIKKNFDSLLNSSYYDLVGVMNDGSYIIIRCPIARIESTIKIISRVFTWVAIAIIIFGSVFILILTNIFSAPIKKLSHAARRMSNLEFDVKIPVVSRDEIGELGASMNDMSYKLEQTISELKTANLQLQRDIIEKEQMDDMRKEFLSHVSHELKTPIALIQGYAEGLKDNLFEDSESREFYADVIIDESHKMNTLVKKLLTLNEIEFGGIKPKIERFELVDFISAVLSASRILFDDAEAKVEFDEKGPIYVWADEYMIEEVFTNYVTNAIHYVEKGGVIKVTIEHIGNDVRVNVYNQGRNIAPEDIDNLFIKFYKADKARTREYGGNGIGLSIVAATMDAHGKKYGVYNVSDGVVFYFDLDANMPC
ncbi:MAG: sensor histidine kinase [Wujia sp.]